MIYVVSTFRWAQSMRYELFQGMQLYDDVLVLDAGDYMSRVLSGRRPAPGDQVLLSDDPNLREEDFHYIVEALLAWEWASEVELEWIWYRDEPPLDSLTVVFEMVVDSFQRQMQEASGVATEFLYRLPPHFVVADGELFQVREAEINLPFRIHSSPDLTEIDLNADPAPEYELRLRRALGQSVDQEVWDVLMGGVIGTAQTDAEAGEEVTVILDVPDS